MKERNLKRIIVEYDNGDIEEVEKGGVIKQEEIKDDVNVIVEFTENTKYGDLIMYINAFISMGLEIGMSEDELEF